MSDDMTGLRQTIDTMRGEVRQHAPHLAERTPRSAEPQPGPEREPAASEHMFTASSGVLAAHFVSGLAVTDGQRKGLAETIRWAVEIGEQRGLAFAGMQLEALEIDVRPGESLLIATERARTKLRERLHAATIGDLFGDMS